MGGVFINVVVLQGSTDSAVHIFAVLSTAHAAEAHHS